MRPPFFGALPANTPPEMQTFAQWCVDCFAEIERASYDDAITAVDGYTIENYTESRTLDASTATAGDIADFLCTLIQDFQNRGQKRQQ